LCPQNLRCRGDTVLLNQTVYESQLAELELLRFLAEAEESVTNNDVIDAKLAFDRIRKELK